MELNGMGQDKDMGKDKGMDSCKAQAKEALKLEDDAEEVSADSRMSQARFMSKKKNGGKKDQDPEAKEAHMAMVDGCMAELGYEADCLEQIGAAFKGAKGDVSEDGSDMKQSARFMDETDRSLGGLDY